ncbi:YbaB/EbfC family nucleoid-associated protein [Actinoplanes sp. NPDC048791]|uniref:YbaB/EbfC family nucleoid-associated protein n=1 Tax=Actinoplanes sp. NPDC048791 TaxID=3154623 RepID=UPI0033CB9FFF
MRDIDSAEEWLETWAAGVDANAARAVELSRRVAELTGEATSRDGSISVAVGSAGQLERLDIDDRPGRLTGAQLSREIMSLIRRAQAQLSARVAAQVEQTVGADTETGRAVIHSYAERFPEPPDGAGDVDPRDSHAR